MLLKFLIERQDIRARLMPLNQLTVDQTEFGVVELVGTGAVPIPYSSIAFFAASRRRG